MLRAAPRNEVAVLAVVSVICKEQFGADEEDLAVQDDDSTIEAVIAMHDGHTYVADDAMDRAISQDDGHLLPRVEVGVRFEDLNCS